MTYHRDAGNLKGKGPKIRFVFLVDTDYMNIFIIFCYYCLHQVQLAKSKH